MTEGYYVTEQITYSFNEQWLTILKWPMPYVSVIVNVVTKLIPNSINLKINLFSLLSSKREPAK